LQPITIPHKDAVYTSAEWADTLTLFHLYQCIYSVDKEEAGVLNKPYSAKPAQRSSHTGLPGKIG
jgi:hypothetical protein